MMNGGCEKPLLVAGSRSGPMAGQPGEYEHPHGEVADMKVTGADFPAACAQTQNNLAALRGLLQQRVPACR